MNFFAASALSPSTDFGMYIAAVPGQTVMPFLAASLPGRAKKPTSSVLPGATFSMLFALPPELRIVRRRAGGHRLHPVVQSGEAKSLLK
jgi:hypothetical protein